MYVIARFPTTDLLVKARSKPAMPGHTLDTCSHQHVDEAFRGVVAAKTMGTKSGHWWLALRYLVGSSHMIETWDWKIYPLS